MDMERAAEKKIKDLGAKPAFKGYYDYPCVLCTSINEEIVHGIPSEKRVLKDRRHCFHRLRSRAGRILRRRGDHGCRSVSVTPELRKLLEVTEASLYKGIEQVQIGNRLAMLERRSRNMWKPKDSA